MTPPSERPRVLPPSPKSLPFIGHLAGFARDPLAYLQALAKSHGPVVLLRLIGRNFYFVSGPEEAGHVLVRDAKRYKKDFFMDQLAEVLGRGLLTANGEHWRRQRKLAQPAFQPKRVDAYAPTMARLADGLTETFREGETRDLHADMMRVTLDIVAETLFGAVVRDDASTMANAIDVVQRRYEGLFGTGIVLDQRIPLPIHRKLKKAVRDVDAMLYRVIEARRQSPEDRGDLLGTFLASRDEEGNGMSAESLRDEAITLFMAGHETTALTLTYVFRLLTEHPEIEARLHAELDAVLGDRPPTRADVEKLVLTEAIVEEALRLYPPAWTIGRECTEATTIGPYTIEPGDSVILSQWVAHRDEASFPDALAFKPDRWLGEASKNLPRFAFFPFGGGPRTCIGNQFAMLEAVIVLAAIARTTRILVDLTAPFELVPAITLRPRGPVPARVVARTPRARSERAASPLPP